MDKPKEEMSNCQPASPHICCRIEEQILINGNLDKPVWEKVTKSHRFVDMVTGTPGFFDTRMGALWNDTHLYIAFWIQEPNVQARMTERDSPVYHENDVEIFIGGEDCYYEFQINALGTIYEVFYIWQDAYKKGSRFDTPEFDLLSRKVDVLGGFQDSTRYKKNPRGPRWAFMDWDFPGLKAAVKVAGTLNNDSIVDQGWTVEVAFPWSGMTSLFNRQSIPPGDGETLRMDFSRFQKLSSNGIQMEHHPGWTLDCHGVYDSHLPDRFSVIQFSTLPPG